MTLRTLRRARRASYRTGSALGWVTAILGGRILARIWNVLVWRTLARAARSVTR